MASYVEAGAESRRHFLKRKCARGVGPMGSQATFDLIFISGRKGRLIQIKRATNQDLAFGHR